ncbi:hypothetical protein PoB_000385600 [Plakobranchus ocellatus]|uniref:Tudor domain-containing protein n=1 Tax=Plakobranchus ocellatus TaxID=259542 RepID=A0AAV3Y4M4_9GAST|nr:hypothetical protein PoB_000385600 [Plakobranchus ocellatus]
MHDWYVLLPKEEKSGLWKKARQDGSQMRQKHHEQDRKAVMDSLHSLKLSEKAPELGDLKPGQMLAFASEDAWYPAVVETSSAEGQNVTVSFAQLGKDLERSDGQMEKMSILCPGEVFWIQT